MSVYRPLLPVLVLLAALIPLAADSGERVISLKDAPLPDGPPPVTVVVSSKRLEVRIGPSNKTKRRGVVVQNSRFSVLERAVGPGCSGEYWYRIGENAWLCGNNLVHSNEPPLAEKQPVVPEGEISPWPYAFVHEPAIEYEKVGGMYREVREVFEGYGFAVEKTVYIDGEPYYRTVEGRYVPKRAAGITKRLSEFAGIAIGKDTPWPIGWINSPKAWAYSEPSRKKNVQLGPVDRYTPFSVLETRTVGKQVFYRFDENAWLSAQDVRVTTTAPRPESVAATERWIDVDLANQIVTAYEGDQPVYATMVSTGRGGESRTIKGEFRIWAKISAIPMDNTDEQLEADTDAVTDTDTDTNDKEIHLFSLQDVPWTQFFSGNYALHGVYWHDRFGNKKSHGCVNLSPKDARWLFHWTRPAIPDGWWAIHSVAGEEATLVRVR